MRFRSLIVPLVAAIAVGVVAFVLANHKSGSSSPRSTATVTGTAAAVTIKNYAFAPQSLKVKAGTRVTWTNRDSTAHTATADQGAPDTGTINSGQSRTITFNRPGTFPYHCAFHAFMTGTITVVR
jgi:plastocyanin